MGEAAKVDRDVHAELTFALEYQRIVLADPKATLADREAADSWVAAARPAAELVSVALRDAEAGYQKRREWESRTATTRAAADTARKELAARGAPTVVRTDDLGSLPTTWVAYQAVRADQALAVKTTALSSAHRAVRRVATRAKRPREAGHTELAAEDLELLERWQADAARLNNEVAVARSNAQRVVDELATRPDGETSQDRSPEDPPRAGTNRTGVDRPRPDSWCNIIFAATKDLIKPSPKGTWSWQRVRCRPVMRRIRRWPRCRRYGCAGPFLT